MRASSSYGLTSARAFLVTGATLVLISFGVNLGVDRAFGHAGEIHSEPAPAVPSASPDPKPERGGAGATDRTEPDSGPAQSAEVTDQAGAEDSPPPPAEPETDPALHFLALGALLVGGGGFLLLRRRRLPA